MTDPRTQADQLMRILEQRVRDIVRQELRAKTGVIPGGPYTEFTVNSQGLVTWASAGVLVDIAPGQAGDDASNPEPEPSVLVSDPESLTTFDTDWYYITIPTTGMYRFTYVGEIIPQAGFTFTAGDVYELHLYVNAVDTATLVTHTVTAPEAAITDLVISLSGTQTLALTAGDVVLLYVDGTWADVIGQDVTTPVSSWKMYQL